MVLHQSVNLDLNYSLSRQLYSFYPWLHLSSPPFHITNQVLHSGRFYSLKFICNLPYLKLALFGQDVALGDIFAALSQQVSCYQKIANWQIVFICFFAAETCSRSYWWTLKLVKLLAQNIINTLLSIVQKKQIASQLGSSSHCHLLGNRFQYLMFDVFCLGGV